MILKKGSKITPPHFQFENIIIWRHAEAEQADMTAGEYDVMRQLTSKGRTQAKRMARWLKQHIPKGTVVVCSPAIRALQTAETLSYKIHTIENLKPSANLTDVLQALSELSAHEHVLIVGHQPWLGQLASFLFELTTNQLTDIAPKYTNTSIKKGAVWWLRLRSEEKHPTTNLRYQLLTIQTPSLL